MAHYVVDGSSHGPYIGLNNNNNFISQRIVHVLHNNVYMMTDCQVGRSPSMLAAHNCVLIIADNTNEEKKRTKNITYNSIISLQPN